jgi:predicted nucleic acid-binding protein
MTARRHGFSAYDAVYLDLAQQERLPLATLDERLRLAAAASGVRLLK